MTDPIADMLTRIRNAQMIARDDVCVPYSKIKHAIAQLLVEEAYLGGCEVDPENPRLLRLQLRYYRGKPVIEKLIRVSKPGCRIYAGKTDIPRTLGGMGMTIVSTALGVMNDRDARSQGVGGEVLCQVY